MRSKSMLGSVTESIGRGKGAACEKQFVGNSTLLPPVDVCKSCGGDARFIPEEHNRYANNFLLGVSSGSVPVEESVLRELDLGLTKRVFGNCDLGSRRSCIRVLEILRRPDGIDGLDRR